MPDPTRRLLLAGGAALATLGAAPTSELSRDSADRAWDYVFPSIDGGLIPLGEYRGKVLLVVNTASFCGFTPQYKGLQALQDRFGPQGLTVIGVPSNDFGQETGGTAKVKTICEAYQVSFPLAIISHIRGPQAQPFYTWVERTRGWQPDWNFCKVLIGRDGLIAGTFASRDEPDGPVLLNAVQQAVARPAA